MGSLASNVHITVVQKEVRAIVVVDPIDGMIRDNIFFPRQKSTKVGRKGLAVSSHLRIRAVPGYVVDQVLHNVRTRSVGQPRRMGKGVGRIQEALVGPRVLFNVR